MGWLWWAPTLTPWVWIHLGMAMLASWRLAELLALDTITAPLRAKAPAALSCLRCVSVWGAGLALLLWGFFPWANWPLALAWTYLLKEDWGVRRRDTTWPKQIVVSVHPTGHFTLKSIGLPPHVAAEALTAAAALAATYDPPQPLLLEPRSVSEPVETPV